MPKHKDQPPLSSNGKGATCTWCDRDLHATGSLSRLAATRDHVDPKVRGGRVRVWCCRDCNDLKGAMLIGDWKRFLRAHPNWWTSKHLRNQAHIDAASLPSRSVELEGYVLDRERRARRRTQASPAFP